jgi:hypothetical protein
MNFFKFLDGGGCPITYEDVVVNIHPVFIG